MKDEAWMHVVYLAQCAARLRSISARRDGWMVNCWMRIWTHAHILWPEKISLCHYSLVDICGNSDLSYFNVMQLKKKQKQTQMTRISHIAIMCHIADPQHKFFTLSIPFFFFRSLYGSCSDWSTGNFCYDPQNAANTLTPDVLYVCGVRSYLKAFSPCYSEEKRETHNVLHWWSWAGFNSALRSVFPK